MEARIRSPTAYQKRKLQSRSLDKTMKRKERGSDIGCFLAAIMKIAAFFVSVGKIIHKNGVSEIWPSVNQYGIFRIGNRHFEGTCDRTGRGPRGMGRDQPSGGLRQ